MPSTLSSVDTQFKKIFSDSSLTLSKIVQFTLDLKPRDFEIPMSGALYLTLYNIELRDYYKIGQEIVCFYNNKDLLNLINYYLINEKEAEKIRIKGYKKAIANHKWEDRFKFVFTKSY